MKKEKNPRAERPEGLRAYFVRLLGKYDFRNEAHFIYFCKWLSFILLLLVETLLILQKIETLIAVGGWKTFPLLLAVVATLTASMAVQLFAVKGVKGKIAFYVIDVISAGSFIFFAGGGYPLVVYMLVLTPVYFEAQSPKRSVLLWIISLLLYIATYGALMSIQRGFAAWNLFQLFSLTFGFVVALTAHFFAVQIALAFYRQYLRLNKTLQELDESKRELEKAYAVVAEVTALEERQRIAKEIHDTAGHSLTTVIMQTETAKLIIDSNPEEAKNKLIAANLQARHALEELRDSVHLLSGSSEYKSLSDELLAIIHESTDGTGIIIRSEVADVSVFPAKHRFLCNTLKEGISNGLRHGGATAFWFELKVEEGEILFLLSDNGKGAQTFSLGFGLTTMRERARALGGEVTFFSESDEGFEIRLTLPVDTAV